MVLPLKSSGQLYHYRYDGITMDQIHPHLSCSDIPVIRFLLMPGERAGNPCTYPRSTHNMSIFIIIDINILFKICRTTYFVWKITILTNVARSTLAITVPYLHMYKQYRLTQARSSCVLIPGHSNTWIKAQGAYNPSHDTWFDKLQTRNGPLLQLTKPNYKTSTPTRLVLNSHCPSWISH